MSQTGRFSDRTYAIPFGRYVGASEVEPPADEVLVGREGQRAYLIEVLISSGRRGAYLVTGRRGTGKSSFVKHCIAEYEASVFSRFLRANVGRGVWDRLFVLIFLLAILLGGLVASELTQLLVPLAHPPEGHNVLLWVLLAPLGVFLLFPCVYAKVAFETILNTRAALRDTAQPGHEESTGKGYAGTWATVFVIGLGLAFWLLPPAGSPVLGLSFFIPMISCLYLTAQAISFGARNKKPGPRWPVYLLLGLQLLLVGAATLWAAFTYSSIAAFRAQTGLGLILIGLGSALRGWHQKDCAKRACVLDRTDYAGSSSRKRSLEGAIDSGTSWYFLAAALAFVAGTVLWVVPFLTEGKPGKCALLLPFLPLAACAVALVGFGSRETWATERKGKKEEKLDLMFRPRPAWVLAAKSVLSIVISLQLAYPVLSRLHASFESLPFEICRSHQGQLWSLCGLAESHPQSKLFALREEEENWLLALLVLLICLHILEYEWIVRPFTRSREGNTFDPGNLAAWDDWEYEEVPLDRRRGAYRELAELSIPWAVYKNWLPVLPVAVNLGFDKLDHRQVIQAMLAGLRERYYRTFLAWNSGFANLGRFLGILFLLTLVTLTSEAWFARREQPIDDTKIEGIAGKVWPVLKFDLLPRSGHLGAHSGNENEHLILYDLVPFSDTQPEGIYFRVYHILLFTLFFLLGQWALYRIPLLPYKENLRRITDLLDSLSARTRVTSSLSLWGPARWIYSIFSDERIRETERDPVEPRSVELAFLQILEDVQKGGFRFPGAARHHLTMPAPEITFIFDELDKLGTRSDPEMRTKSAQEQELKVQIQERERAIRLRSLLSDLKNILASAPARFIFVGGRDLHDEWLADQNSRQPLFTSIFTTEVYLPSLLTDPRDAPKDAPKNPPPPPSKLEPRLHHRTEEYLFWQHYRAHLLHLKSVSKRWRPSFGLPIETLAQERFAPATEIEDLPELISCTSAEIPESEGKALVRDFVLFLTHRSMGNPKKLKDLLASFIRPSGRKLLERRWDKTSSRQLLFFGDDETFRIQLVVDIYRHLALAFEQRMVRRDDKFAISIFFLTDFLFKFHRRAFSWSNLARVDDLTHIHRLPDLRNLQEEMVNHFSERFLHRVHNGMYAFRFRSDIAREVEYLSRRSDAEMAAFNFTLDESQSLKAEYIAALEGKEGQNPDLVAALGELHEFDQDFESARNQYRIAIDLLDEKLVEKTEALDSDTEKRPHSTIRAILSGDTDGAEDARLSLSWGVARVRLMLQIGMTFEYARDLERAEAEYRNARTLSRALVRAYVDAVGRSEEPGKSGSRLHSLKQLNILFQPIYAEAWISEKFAGSIDTSISLVERVLWEIRRTLPFVRESMPDYKDENRRIAQPRHANFALTLSLLHNKGGDLYFFKGRQPVEPPPGGSSSSSDRKSDGYLLRAHYHYALGLHDIRRYVQFRAASSQERLSISHPKAPTLQARALPDFLFRAAAGGVNDMAEATLARISLFDLFGRLEAGGPEENQWEDLKDQALEWLGSTDAESRSSPLKNWFGRWESPPEIDGTTPNLIYFEGPDDAAQRLSMSLRLCLAGASFFEVGGYPEDAARELLQVCESVTRYLWWGLIVAKLGTWPVQGALWPEVNTPVNIWGQGSIEKPDRPMQFWQGLVTMAISALKNADRLFRQSRYQADKESVKTPYLVGTTIPPEALTLLCSLGLAGQRVMNAKQEEDLNNLLQDWTGRKDSLFASLRGSIERHRYPMINRLHGIKILVDSLVLTNSDPTSGIDQALTWTEELLDLNEHFDAPLHFTPLHSGTTCALVWLWGQRTDKRGTPELERIYRAAQRDLQNSEEMYTMRRAYYEAISDLYYLYDDFNDRQIHFNHAIQMAGADLTTLLRRRIAAGERAAR